MLSKSIYLLINAVIIIFPLLLSFENKLKFYKKIPQLLISLIIVGIPFLIWDVFATARGDWGFNPSYTLNIKLLGLPIEEILFFFTVPYAILFLYETFLYYIPNNKQGIQYNLFIIPSLLSFLSAYICSGKSYTLIVLLIFSFTSLLLAITKPIFLKQKYFGLFILFTFIPFGIVNFILTSLPVVYYNQKAIWGIRISNIPLEDFIYSFSLISLYVFFYELAKGKWVIND